MPPKPPPAKPTRRQVAHWKKEERRRRLIIVVSTIAIVTILALTGYGVYQGQKPLGETVVEVNGETFNMRYYLDALEYYMTGQPTQYVQFYLDPVAEAVKLNALIRQGAHGMDFYIDESEIDQAIAKGKLPNSQAVRDIIETELLLDKLREEKFGPEVPDEDLQRHIQAMFLESETQAEEVRERILEGEDFQKLASSLSLDSTTKENGDLGWHPQGILQGLLNTSVDIDEFAFLLPVGEIDFIADPEKTKGVGYWIIRVVERDEAGQGRVEAMLLTSLEEAGEIRGQLEDGDFADLSEKYSQWEGSGEHKGDLGWVSPGDMSEAFDGFVFSEETEVGIISEPIKDNTVTTRGGYWLIKVVAKEESKPLSEEDRETLISQRINEWITSLEEDPSHHTVIHLNDEMRKFAINRFM